LKTNAFGCIVYIENNNNQHRNAEMAQISIEELKELLSVADCNEEVSLLRTHIKQLEKDQESQ